MTKLTDFLRSEELHTMLREGEVVMGSVLARVSHIIAEDSSSVSLPDSKTGDTPLHLASEFIGSVALAKLLIDNGANVDARSKDGCTALHRAVFAAINKKGNADRFINVAKFLAKKVSDIDVRGVPGRARDILAIGLDPEFTKDATALAKLRELGQFFDEIKKDFSAVPSAVPERPSTSPVVRKSDLELQIPEFVGPPIVRI